MLNLRALIIHKVMDKKETQSKVHELIKKQ